MALLSLISSSMMASLSASYALGGERKGDRLGEALNLDMTDFNDKLDYMKILNLIHK